jgi:hypothetical protein
MLQVLEVESPPEKKASSFGILRSLNEANEEMGNLIKSSS